VKDKLSNNESNSTSCVGEVSARKVLSDQQTASAGGVPTRSATVVITTKDRPQLAVEAIRSALKQTVNAEIVVLDDGSAVPLINQVPDELSDKIVLVRNEEPRGIILARNQAFDCSSGEIVFTLDDDAVFDHDQVLENVLRDFDAPEVGVVSIPITDHYPDGTTNVRMATIPREENFLCVANFSGCANAIRRNLFLDLGGYQGDGRQGEERNFSLRVLQRGLIIRVGSQSRVTHRLQHIGGRPRDVHTLNMRANIRFGWNLVPFPELIAFWIGTTLTHLKAAWRDKAMHQTCLGWIWGMRESLMHLSDRQPVERGTFYAFRELLTFQSIRRSELVELLRRHNVHMHSERWDN
jgi:GT2 family glycosyltransferase